MQVIFRFSEKHKAKLVKQRKKNVCSECKNVIQEVIIVKEYKGAQCIGFFHESCFDKVIKEMK